MKKTVIILGFEIIFTILLVNVVLSVPASPHPFNLTQPDGAIFEAYLRGDEHINWIETNEGYTVIKNKQGWWTYAEEDTNEKDGITQLKATNKIVGKIDKDKIELKKHIHYKPKKPFDQKSYIQKKDVSIQYVGGGGSSGSGNYFDPVNGSLKLLVLLVNFTDKVQNNTHTVAHYSSLLFNESNNAKSLHNYYKEVSYNKIDVSGYISSKWYTSNRTMSYYGADADSSPDINCIHTNDTTDSDNDCIYNLVRNVVQLANNDINFSEYDLDKDGVVDYLVIIHSGCDQADSSCSDINPIWSHKWYIDACYGDGVGGCGETVDGVDVEGYTMLAEDSPLGTFAHEFGHSIGLPDLYDTDNSSYGIGKWGVMGSGSWLEGGTNPSHFSAWSKVMKGWIVPNVVTSSGRFDILETENQTDTKPKIYEIDYNDNKYFLIENRQKVGYDLNLPGEGLLIWHIDNSKIDNRNETHKMVDLEEADGDDDLDELLPFGNQGDDDDPWPDCWWITTWFCNRDFYNESNPNSNNYNNIQTGIAVLNISNKGPTMSAAFIPSNYTGNIKIMRVYNFGNGLLNITSIVSSDLTHINASPSNFIIIPDLYNNVTISVYGAFNNGENNYTLTISSNDPDSPTIVTIVVLKNKTTLSYFGASYSPSPTPTGDTFSFKQGSEEIAIFDSAGNLFLKNTLIQSSNPLDTADDEFLLRDNSNTVVAKINSTGYMEIKGTLSQNQGSLSDPAGDDFLIKDGNNVVAYINESGFMFLKGSLYENYG